MRTATGKSSLKTVVDAERRLLGAYRFPDDLEERHSLQLAPLQLQVVQDQLQTVRRLLASQQADTKKLSEQVVTLTESIDGLRQSFASARTDDPKPSVRKSSRKKIYRSAQRKRSSKG